MYAYIDVSLQEPSYVKYVQLSGLVVPLGKPTHHAGLAPWPSKPRKWGRRQIPGFADKPMGINGFYEKSMGFFYYSTLYTYILHILHTYIHIYIYMYTIYTYIAQCL